MPIPSECKGATLVICLSPHSGGMEMDAIKMAKLLCGEIKVVLLAKAGCYIADYCESYMTGGNFDLETIKFSSNFSFSIISKTRKIIDKYDIKNVIFFGASELRSLYFAFLNLDLTVIVRHGTTKTTPKKDFLHRMVYSCVDYHVAICQHLAKNVQEIIPFGKNTRLNVIYPSLRSQPVLPESRSGPRPVVLLHVGRVTDGKGQKEAVEACEILFRNNMAFKLICVGEIDSAYINEFRTYLASKPYSDCIELAGFTQNIDPFYQRADVFIFPSKGEGLSNAFIEALSYGLVCLAFSNTSFPELVDLGFKINLAKDHDISDLKNKLLECVRVVYNGQIPLLEQSQLAVDLFSAERELNEYLGLLQ
jgi:glycosyltransferase involved in cell wall biosynthesis